MTYIAINKHITNGKVIDKPLKYGTFNPSVEFNDSINCAATAYGTKALATQHTYNTYCIYAQVSPNIINARANCRIGQIQLNNMYTYIKRIYRRYLVSSKIKVAVSKTLFLARTI